MSMTLPATIKKKRDRINIEIKKEDFESFCNAVGLFRADFLRELKCSEADHKAGRVTKRASLYELVGKV